MPMNDSSSYIDFGQPPGKQKHRNSLPGKRLSTSEVTPVDNDNDDFDIMDDPFSVVHALHSDQERGCALDPESTRVRYWEAFIMALLIYTAFATPYEVAFMESGSVDGLFFWNRLIDLCFVCDMVVAFILPYKNGPETYETSSSKIARRYLSGWFVIDLISIFPFDLIGIVMDSGGSEGQSASDLKVLRVVRCLRLVKLIRLAKASTTIQKFVRKYGVRNSALTLLKFAVAVVVISHWMSCLWMLVPKLEQSDKSWTNKYFGEVGSRSASKLYLICCYWSVMTLTTIGYGDVTASTDGEMFLCILGMAIGASTYAYIVGAICGVINNMDPIGVEFNQKMDSLNLLMSDNHIPQEIREDLRDFLYRSKPIFQDRAYNEVYKSLSPGLRRTILGFMHRDWVSRVGLFKTLPPDEKSLFIMRMAMSMSLKAYAKSSDASHTNFKCHVIHSHVI